MKLSSNFRAQEFRERLQAWTPAELEAGDSATPEEPQKEKILALFRGEVETGGQTERQPALHQGEKDRHIRPWQPGEISVEPDQVCKPEWTFVGPAGAALQVVQPPSRFEFEALEEDISQEEPEEQISSILEEARLQAEAIILAAQTEVDQMLLQAKGEIDEQKKEGFQAGRKQAIAELEDTLKAVRVLVEEVQGWKTDLMAQGERILVEMLVDIGRKMFGEGVELSPEALQINLNRIMENAQGLGDLKIFLNPRDAKLLDSSWSEYQMLVTGDKVKIIPSGRITVGGCYIMGNMGNVDGRVETQLNAILKTFEETSE